VQVEGDGNCLTNCVQLILQTFRKITYSVKDLKLWLTLHVCAGLVNETVSIEANLHIEANLKKFLSIHGESNVRASWKNILQKLDAPDKAQTSFANKRHNMAQVFESVRKENRRNITTLNSVYAAAFENLILQDKYYLPSEALSYYCQAFSLNISIWYPDLDRVGFYYKGEEYGEDHESSFMIRQCPFQLDVNAKKGTWNKKREQIIYPKFPHFDVLFLKPDKVIEMYDANEEVLKGIATFTDEFKLFISNPGCESSASSSSSSASDKRQGKLYALFFLIYPFI
jgi:hypothetical protein